MWTSLICFWLLLGFNKIEDIAVQLQLQRVCQLVRAGSCLWLPANATPCVCDLKIRDCDLKLVAIRGSLYFSSLHTSISLYFSISSSCLNIPRSSSYFKHSKFIICIIFELVSDIDWDWMASGMRNQRSTKFSVPIVLDRLLTFQGGLRYRPDFPT